jgi:formate hydrogenlyase subunit 3/multisubunit Na+/H+ antiporter MnhD subunit
MIEILFQLLPFITIFVCAILSMSMSKKINLNRGVAFYGLILALLLNTILFLFGPTETTYSQLTITRSGLFFNELILVFACLIFYSIQTNLKKSHTEEFVSTNFLIFISSLMGLFLTENLLILTVFFVLACISIGILFFFGPYKKKISTINNFFLIILLSGVFLVVMDVITYLTIGSLKLSTFSDQFPSLAVGLQLLLFFGYLCGFGLTFGLIPALNFHLKEFFHQNNPVNLRGVLILFFPIGSFLTIRILHSTFNGTNLIPAMLYFIGIVGVLVSSSLIFIELFGKGKNRSRSVFKILGLSAITEFHLILVLASLVNIDFILEPMKIYENIILLICVIMLVKTLWIESFSPIYESVDEFDFEYVGGFIRYYPKFLIFLIAIPVIYAMPFFPGFFAIKNLIPSLTVIDKFMPILNAMLFFTLILLVVYIAIVLIIVATMLNEIFLGKSELSKSEIVPKIKKNYYYIPTITIVLTLILTIELVIDSVFAGTEEYLYMISLSDLARAFFM